MRSFRLVFCFGALLLCLFLSAACETPTTSTTPSGPASVQLSDLQQIVPGMTFPSEVKINHANNNLDIIDFDGRFFLVFRTAPNHFASPEVDLYVVSSKDQKTWDFEAKVHVGSDLREPRFFAWKDKLTLYFTQLGAKSTAFEPGKTYRIERQSQGAWTSPALVFDTGFLVWRFKEHNGTPILIGYEGGENIYNFSGKPLLVYLKTTEDGKTWKPLNPDRPVVLKSGASETDIAFDNDGNLFAVARNEAGDEDGFGSKICTAPKTDITKWTCKKDLKKYDSPLVFAHKGEIYLIGRKNMTATGNFDLQMDNKGLDHAQKFAEYSADYWVRPKRCSLWYLRKETLTIEHLKELPSKGDTCFPSAVQRGENRFLIYNYSSPVDGPDISWNDGQKGETHIYSIMLDLLPPTPK
ncbi:MAG: hypothetical protein H6728_06230 [Myxococcales bacterium]|nr:hypothetical protein [Myxococcales bacterium]MCB9642656.1 hypothetical protein [Myxococcales bacterium]